MKATLISTLTLMLIAAPALALQLDSTYYVVLAGGRPQYLAASDSLFLVQLRNDADQASEESVVLQLRELGFQVVNTQGPSDQVGPKILEISQGPQLSRSAGPQQAESVVNLFRAVHSASIGGFLPVMRTAGGIMVRVAPGCLAVRFTSETKDPVTQLRKLGLSEYDPSPTAYVKERYLLNMVRINPPMPNLSIYENIALLRQKPSIEDVYPVLLSDLNKDAFDGYLSDAADRQIATYLSSRGLISKAAVCRLLYVLDRYGYVAALSFGKLAGQIESDTMFVRVSMDGTQADVPLSLLGAGLTRTSPPMLGRIVTKASGDERRITDFDGMIFLTDLVSLGAAPGVVNIRPIGSDVNLGQLIDNSCWPGGACPPPCTSQGLRYVNLQEWRTQGYVGSRGYAGSKQRIGIIDPEIGQWDLQSAVNQCALDSTQLDSSHTRGYFTAQLPLGGFHGVLMAEVIKELAPCSQLYLARLDPQNPITSMYECRNWLRDHGVTAVAYAFNFGRLGPGDGTGALNAVVDSMLLRDGMTVFGAAGNYADKHHEQVFSPYGVMTYPWTFGLANLLDTSLSSPDSTLGLDPLHNFTQQDDDMSFEIDSNQFIRAILSWRDDKTPDGLESLWDFDLILRISANDDTIRLTSIPHGGTGNDGNSDQRTLTGGLLGWGDQFNFLSDWPNVEVLNYTYTGPGTARAHLMVVNWVAVRCDSTYPADPDSNCFVLAPSTIENPPYIVELTVTSSFGGFHFEEEAKPDRSAAAYLDSAGSMPFAPMDHRGIMSIGAYSSAHTFDTTLLNYPPKEPYSSMAPGNDVFTVGRLANIDLVAPDSSILVGTFSFPQFCSDYASGTSFSAPYAAGLAALVLQRHPCGLTSTEMRDTLVAWSISDSAAANSRWGPYARLRDGVVHSFECGDVNANGTITSSDITYELNYVLKGGPAPLPVAESGDGDCSGDASSADIIVLVNYVFKAGPHPCELP